MRNALAHVPKGQHTMVAAAIRQAFLQPDAAAAHQTWRHVADQPRSRWPKLAALRDDSEHVAFDRNKCRKSASAVFRKYLADLRAPDKTRSSESQAADSLGTERVLIGALNRRGRIALPLYAPRSLPACANRTARKRVVRYSPIRSVES
jgi:hypothetical protein